MGSTFSSLGCVSHGHDAEVFEAHARSSAQSSRKRSSFGLRDADTLASTGWTMQRFGSTLTWVELLLTQKPRWRERVRLVQVAVPSRQNVAAYRRTSREVETLVGRINGKFGTPNWTPVVHLHQSFPPESVVALYRTRM